MQKIRWSNSIHEEKLRWKFTLDGEDAAATSTAVVVELSTKHNSASLKETSSLKFLWSFPTGRIYLHPTPKDYIYIYLPFIIQRRYTSQAPDVGDYI